MTRGREQGLVIAAAVAACVAFAMSWHVVRATPDAVRQIRRKTHDLEKLQDLRKDQSVSLGAMRLLEQAGPPRRIEELLGGRAAEVRPRKDLPLLNGWLLQSADVLFVEADLADVAVFMADAENARPPWRVAECSITAADAPGRGRVALTMEAIRKQ